MHTEIALADQIERRRETRAGEGFPVDLAQGVQIASMPRFTGSDASSELNTPAVAVLTVRM
ncbi:hypothetical protein ACIA5E_01020 [Nocardia asteroides]|uniref:hypothetical protein n=1 Tax=Nocardia asteroides TaxID=1824 RepID=UPI0037937191